MTAFDPRTSQRVVGGVSRDEQRRQDLFYERIGLPKGYDRPNENRRPNYPRGDVRTPMCEPRVFDGS